MDNYLKKRRNAIEILRSLSIHNIQAIKCLNHDDKNWLSFHKFCDEVLQTMRE